MAKKKTTKKKATPKAKAKPAEKAGGIESPPDSGAKKPKPKCRAFAHVHNRSVLIPHAPGGGIEVRNWHVVTDDPKKAEFLEEHSEFIEFPADQTAAFIQEVRLHVTTNPRAAAEIVRGRAKS